MTLEQTCCSRGMPLLIHRIRPHLHCHMHPSGSAVMPHCRTRKLHLNHGQIKTTIQMSRKNGRGGVATLMESSRYLSSCCQHIQVTDPSSRCTGHSGASACNNHGTYSTSPVRRQDTRCRLLMPNAAYSATLPESQMAFRLSNQRGTAASPM